MSNQVPVDELMAGVAVESLLGIIASLKEGVLALDDDLRIVTLNSAAEEILGRDRRELTGTPVCDLFGELHCPRDVLAETLRAGEAIIDFQTTIRLGSGRSGQVLLRSAPLKMSDGAGLGVALILGDVTEVTDLRKRVSGTSGLGRLVGRDPRMRELYELITGVARSEATVLIRGESGTGKELVARAVHEASGRASGPFIQVNCSALSETLLESELFGHVRGAYTGAVSDRLGRFEEAEGGTLFLDEIGDVSPAVQVKLLRVLQERVIERVGDNRPVPVDVRVVSATNQDLEVLLATGRIREDFFYRIKVVTLPIPPLRDRTEDIPQLINHFLRRLVVRDGLESVPEVSEGALRSFMNYRWPGNVRELEHALEHSMVLSRGGTIHRNHLPPELTRDASGRSRGLAGVQLHSKEEREILSAALEQAGWNRSRAARRLGIDRTTLWRKVREYGLEPED